MEGIHQWILAVTAVSVLTAICQAVMPPGPVKRVSNMTCGLMLFVTIVQPVVRADYAQLFRQFEAYYNSLGEYDTTLEETNGTLTRDIIARDTEAYIEDKTAEAGIACAVRVQCGEKNGVPVPASMTVTGSLRPEERTLVTSLAVEDLGMEGDAVRFEEKEGGA